MIDITGKRFGRLVVIRYVGDKAWECQCDCGKKTTGYASDMKRGFKKSCGCLRHEVCKAIHVTHGMSYSPEYRVWAAMLDRCRLKTDAGYKNYGGRGIEVCDRWYDFANFYSDMGPRPSGYTIDRINNDGNYEPGNCRWATRAEQNRNSRNCHWLTVDGETKLIIDWSRQYGIGEGIIRTRLIRGWSVEDAVKLPTEWGRKLIPGPSVKGELNPSCKISDVTVVRARELCAMGKLYYSEIAAILGVKKKWVESISRGRKRRDAGGPILSSRKANNRYSDSERLKVSK